MIDKIFWFGTLTTEATTQTKFNSYNNNVIVSRIHFEFCNLGFNIKNKINLDQNQLNLFLLNAIRWF